jgi:hypothetical protein
VGAWADRVCAFSVTSSYSRGGEPLRDQVVAWLEKNRIQATTLGANYAWGGNT